MQMKTFRAATMKEAIAAVKAGLGPDAVILTTRTVRSPLNLLGRPEIEITAALDPDAKGSAENRPAAGSNPAASAPNPPTLSPEGRDERMDEIVRRIAALESTGADAVRRRMDRLTAQLDDLTSLVSQIVDGARDPDAPVGTNLLELATNRALRDDGKSASAFATLHARLLDKGVRPALADEIMGEAREAAEGEADEFTALAHVAASLMKRLRVADPFTDGKGQRVCALVGPTGVGKTTTLAKLAAQQVLDQRRKGAFITVDTFRIGAVDQLRAYGRIMNVPVDVATDEADLREKIARHADKDVIFVDTAGVSQKDRMMLGKMAAVLGGERAMDVHLILSATTQYADLADIAERFNVLPITSVIGSKLDECNALGGFFSLAATHPLPLSWFTVGQNVPDDIETATRERVVDLLLGVTAH